MSRRDIIKLVLIYDYITSTRDGGTGSGNFGHSGRPGKVGGSGKGGGSVFRTGNKESGFVGIKKSKTFSGIAEHARANNGYYDFIQHLTSEQKETLKQQHKDCGTKESLQQYSERVFNMLHASKAGKKASASSWKPVDGKDISKTFKRDKEKYPFEINDVIHQQGFDGHPKVVSSEEFDKFVLDNPEQPLLFRSYTANNQKMLAEYDKQLENGEWYVDCGTGGAQYGQGMYTVGVYNRNTSSRWKEKVSGEMIHYRELNEGRLYTDNGFRDTPSTTTYEQPTYMTCPIDPDNAYKLPTNDEDWKKPEDIEIKPGSVYCMEKELSSGVSTYTMLYANEDKKLYYIDKYATVSESDLSNSMKKDVRIAECDPYPKDEINIKPVSTTRCMSLAPGSKIITYENLQKEYLEERKKRIDEIIDRNGPDEYIKMARNIKIGSMGLQEIKRETISELYSASKNAPEEVKQEIRSLGGEGLRSRFSKYTYSPEEAGIMRFIKEGAMGQGKKWKFFEWAEKQPAYQREIAEINSRAEEYAKNNWKSIARTSIPSSDLNMPLDMGVFAAARGYDAIDAKGHGLTGSYTVVLNRSKVVLRRDPWEV